MIERGIVGANGFLGKEMKRQILESGEKGVFLTRKEFDLLGSEIPKLETIPEVIIYCADYYPGLTQTEQSPQDVYFKNIRMYFNQFEMLVKNGIRHVITIGTTACYPTIDTPLGESLIEQANQGSFDKLNPKMKGYALSRFTLLQMAKIYEEKYGIRHNHLVLPNFYGEGDKFQPGQSHLLASWVRDFHKAKQNVEKQINLWGSPNCQREFIYIGDAASYVLSLSNALLDETILNVGTATTPTYQELAEKILQALDYSSKGKLSWDTSVKNTREREILDLSRLSRHKESLPQSTSLEIGIKRTVDYFLNNYPNSVK